MATKVAQPTSNANPFISNFPSVTGRPRVKVSSLKGGVALTPEFDGEKDLKPSKEGEKILTKFIQSINQNDWKMFESMFLDEPDSHWRDNVALTFDRRTFTGKESITENFKQLIELRKPHLFTNKTSDTEVNLGDEATFLRLAPVMASLDVPFSFVTSTPASLKCVGMLKCVPKDVNGKQEWKIWVLSTFGVELVDIPFQSLPLKNPSDYIPKEQRGKCSHQGFPEIKQDTILDAVVIGGAMSGLADIIQLDAMGINAVCFDINLEAGSEWKNERYQSLQLHHNKISVQLPRFPAIEKYQDYMTSLELADYYRSAIEELNLPIFAGCKVEQNKWNEKDKSWSVTIRCMKSDQTKTIRSKNLILASGFIISQKFPLLPLLPGQDDFNGTVMHTAEVRKPEQFDEKEVIVVGSGNSAHDVAGLLAREGNPKSVTILQRSPSILSNFAPFEALFMARYQGQMPVNTADFAETSMPTGVLRDMAKGMIHGMMHSPDMEAHQEELRKVGYLTRQDFCLMSKVFEERGKGTYIDQPKTFKLVFDGKIKIERGEAKGFEKNGLIVQDITKEGQPKRTLSTQAVILATGYKSYDLPKDFVQTGFLEKQVADQLENAGDFGIDEEGEMPGFFTHSGHPNFFFGGFGFLMCRWMSRMVALEVGANVLNEVPKRLPRHFKQQTS